MVRAFLKWLGEWLLATLLVFLVFSGVIIIFTLAMMFVTWSVPEFNDIGSILTIARALLAGSAFIGFCLTVAHDFDDEW
ncbi:cell division protein FtsK [Escherichia coli]|uniref:cell division protein FtsK n=1 Tax=Escherichia coli TaxID=562 RepID=UPI00106FEBC3|nr:cell division protein FtsK [Escherichia coli]